MGLSARIAQLAGRIGLEVIAPFLIVIGMALPATKVVVAMKDTTNADLTIKATTKQVSIDFEFGGVAQDPFGNTRMGFEGSLSINRQDYGVAFNAALETGGVLVSDKVDIDIEVSAVKLVDANA